MWKKFRMRWAGHVARMREKRNAYRILVVNQEGRRPLGRSRSRRMEIIKIVWIGFIWLMIGTGGGLL
jgi:hypothetical protein